MFWTEIFAICSPGLSPFGNIPSFLSITRNLTGEIYLYSTMGFFLAQKWSVQVRYKLYGQLLSMKKFRNIKICYKFSGGLIILYQKFLDIRLTSVPKSHLDWPWGIYFTVTTITNPYTSGFQWMFFLKIRFSLSHPKSILELKSRNSTPFGVINVNMLTNMVKPHLGLTMIGLWYDLQCIERQ